MARVQKLPENLVVGQSYNLEGDLSGDYVYKGGDPKTEDSWVDADTWAATGTKIKAKITGEGRYDPEIKEFAVSPEAGGSVADVFRGEAGIGEMGLAGQLGLLGAHSDEAAMNVIKSQIPDAQFRKDEHGNLLAVVESGEYYINRPGFSAQDATKAAFTVLSFIGIGKIPIPSRATGAWKATSPFQLGAPGVGLGGNVLRSGAAGAGTSMIEDVATEIGGGEQRSTLGGPLGIDLIKAAKTGALTGAFQLGADVLLAAIPSLASTLKSTQIKLGAADDSIFSSTGALTANGEAVLKQLGVEWKQMTQEFKDRLRNEFIKGTAPASPEEAVLYTEAQTLPVSVPLTRGMLSRDREAQILEDLAAKGVHGDEAKQLVKDALEAAEKALQANVPAIQGIITEGAPAIARGEGAMGAQVELLALRQAEKIVADNAYAAARALSESTGATIPSNFFTGFGDYVMGVVTKSHALDDPILQPLTGFLNKLKTYETKEGGVAIRDLFDLRKQINTKMAGGKGNELSVALKTVIKELDSKIDDLMEASLSTGDDVVIQIWRDAIQGYKTYAGRWKQKDLLDKITRTELNESGEVVLTVNQGDVANFIFNAGNLGFVTKKGLQRDLLKMKDKLSPESWNGLRQEVYLRLIQSSTRKGTEVEVTASLLKNVNTALRNNKSLMESIFNKEEIALIKQFSKITDTVLNTAKQSSNTAVAQMNVLRQLGAALGVPNIYKFFAAIPGAKGIIERFRVSQVKGAVDAAPKLPSAGRTGVVPGIIGLEGREILQAEPPPLPPVETTMNMPPPSPMSSMAPVAGPLPLIQQNQPMMAGSDALKEFEMRKLAGLV